jgi:hypothetical protein
MTPFDYLGALLDRIRRYSPVLAYLIALAIVALCALALAYLNADSPSTTHVPISYHT